MVQLHIQITESIKHGKAVKHVCTRVPMTGLKGEVIQVLMRQESGRLMGLRSTPAITNAVGSFASSVDGIGTEDYKGRGRPSADMFDRWTKGLFAGWKQAFWCNSKASYTSAQFLRNQVRTDADGHYCCRVNALLNSILPSCFRFLISSQITFASRGVQQLQY